MQMCEALFPPRVFTIPPSADFASALIDGLSARFPVAAPFERADTLILLPNRRTARSLRAAFLRDSGGRAVILPRLQPIEDVDEDALALSGTDSIDPDLPPAIDPVRRLLLLSRFVAQAWGNELPMAQAMALANALASLIDLMHTHNIQADALRDIVPDEFAQHWQKTLSFLMPVLRDVWPAYLQELQLMEPALRRRLLLEKLARNWAENPPAHPVIVAGVIAGNAATANLMRTTARLPMGAVVLPGLDTIMDDAAWDDVTAGHAQAHLKTLLSALSVTRADVAPWHENAAKNTDRDLFISRLMAPPAHVTGWQKPIDATAAQGITVIEADHAEEEARVIALALREVVETPETGRSAVLITPDRALAARVRLLLRRWGIAIDDSGGTKLSATPVGRYLSTTARLLAAPLSPLALLTVLTHALATGGADWPTDAMPFPDFVRALDRDLREPMTQINLQTLRDKNAAKPEFLRALDALSGCLASPQTLDIPSIVRAHLTLAQTLSSPDLIWAGNDGEAASVLFQKLLLATEGLALQNAEEYAQLVLSLLDLQNQHTAADATHPNLQILGQMEGRFTRADLVILGGMNEGVWPITTRSDPWMSRPMRDAAGLPSAEQSVTLAAHDFAQSLGAQNVLLTHARRRGGEPALPSRWLERFAAYQTAQGWSKNGAHDYLLRLARTLDTSAAPIASAMRPAPIPPLSARPRKLPVTTIARWMEDPYSVYARAILRLYKWNALGLPPTPADRGNVLHKVLEKFVDENPSALPPDARAQLVALSESAFAAIGDPEITVLHGARFSLLLDSFLGWEDARRADIRTIKTELKGSATLTDLPTCNPFTIEGRADRVELLRDGSVHIVDYKTGTPPSKKAMLSTDAPQLALLGLIAREGGFDGIAQGTDVSGITYLGIGGGDAVANNAQTGADVAAFITEIRDIVATLVAHFDHETTAYTCLPPSAADTSRYDYALVARVAEWMGGA